MDIRPYHRQRDEPLVYGLWQRALGNQWPLPLKTFRHKVNGHPQHEVADHFVACEGEEVIGFVATQTPMGLGGEERAGLMCLLVTPDRQRQGVGRALHDHALDALCRRGVTEAQLGAGGLSYFWAGVPTNLPGALAFFRACGWPDTGPAFDLVMDLTGYATPASIYERIRRPDVTLSVAGPEDVSAVLEFEAQHFPRWVPHYQKVVDHGAISDLVLARERTSGRVLGVSSVLDSRREWQRFGFCIWQQMLGESVGGVGPLGVAEDAQGQGIGLALAARVTELLHARGLATSFVGYTWLADWYGRLGYRVWQEYRTSWRAL
ncbi:MAG TPA: GNAT family N-acetyltransferase [Chthonomonadaceae bacterium]|nr:GNAT family N-acetyltransferase [Chthonomonadaceae bacterium]